MHCQIILQNKIQNNKQVVGKFLTLPDPHQKTAIFFPRLTVPISIIISNLITFSIQFILFLIVLAYYYFNGANIHPNKYLLLLPLLLVMMAGLGLGMGIIISALTTKYRDLRFLMAFGVQLMMYASPVIYPISSLEGTAKKIILLNPVSSVIETFKYGFTGVGEFSWGYFLYSVIFMLVILISGVLLFNKVEKTFMDTV